MNNNTIIRAENLTKYYGTLLAVDHINFVVERGECFGLLGPNGAGKTTTVKMITCFSPITEGSLKVFGLDVAQFPRVIKKRIGICHQEVNLDPDLSVYENLIIYSTYFGIDRKTATRQAHQLLKFMALEHKRDITISELSGGMKRRLMLTRALINDPELLILDEPTTGLDPQARHQIWDSIIELKKKGKTVLLTTHYMDEAERLCDRLVIMDEGKILEEGKPSELIKKHIGKNVVELTGNLDEIEKALKTLNKDYERTQNRIIVYSINDESEAYYAIEKITHKESFMIRMATLEDVFLKLTGRELKE